MTTDIPTPYNVNNYFNETEKCSEWEEYFPAGCKERRRVVEVFVTAGGNWPMNSGLKRSYPMQEVRCD